jgi:hypothetical protein
MTLTDVQLARRAHWQYRRAPAGCAHRRGFFEPVGVRQVRKRCRACGAVLYEAPRCGQVTRAGRQCLLPVREDLGYRACAAHNQE